MKTSVKDLLNEIQQRDPATESPIEKEARMDGFKFDEEFNNKLIEYNSKIRELDPLYANLKPLSTNVIVRMFVNELKKTDSGLLLPNHELVRIRTANNLGTLQIVENPYPYSRRGIVVSVPDGFENIKPGDEVILANRPIHATGDGENASIGIPGWFTHPDFTGSVATRDPLNPHYGYVLVDLYRDIQVKV